MRAEYLAELPLAWQSTAKVFTALGDEHRQRILLTFEPHERLNIAQIVEVSHLSRSAISHHLRVLKDAGILESRKEGKEVYFWLNKAHLLQALQLVQTYMETEL